MFNLTEPLSLKVIGLAIGAGLFCRCCWAWRGGCGQ